jgi:hypothetical protein
MDVCVYYFHDSSHHPLDADAAENLYILFFSFVEDPDKWSCNNCK